MTQDELFALFANLVRWQNAGQRAPHKPLLVLYALAEWARGRRSIRYADARQPMIELLRDFGSPDGNQRPEYPFWRLQNDEVWKVDPSDQIKLGKDKGATNKELLRVDATGRFVACICNAFEAHPTLVPALAQFILQAHFPDSLHQDILNAIGLDLSPPCATGGGRDPNFRRLVLNAYGHRCAVCGFQVLLCGVPIVIEAAHIRWHQANGPAEVRNGLCLCTLHHKFFDLGAYTISPEHVTLVSDEASGPAGFTEHLLSIHGKPLCQPTHDSDRPAGEYIEWHRQQVFRDGRVPSCLDASWVLSGRMTKGSVDD